MMASSAAVLSSNMGLYQVNMDAIRDIQIILGINYGKNLWLLSRSIDKAVLVTYYQTT